MNAIWKVLRAILGVILMIIAALVLVPLGFVISLIYATVVTIANGGGITEWWEVLSGYFEGIKIGYQTMTS